jgi:hypothetical protein
LLVPRFLRRSCWLSYAPHLAPSPAVFTWLGKPMAIRPAAKVAVAATVTLPHTPIKRQSKHIERTIPTLAAPPSPPLPLSHTTFYHTLITDRPRPTSITVYLLPNPPLCSTPHFLPRPP